MLNCAIIGFGKMGRIRYQEVLKNNKITVRYIYDPAIKKKIRGINKDIIIKNFKDINFNILNTVFICSHNDKLAPYTKFFLNKGINVFCEKPGAKKVRELLDIKKIVKKKKLILSYGFNHRYHSSVIRAKKIIDSKKLGKILFLRGVYGKMGSIDFNKNWRNFKKISGGGILIDQGIHMIDLFNYLTNTTFNLHSSITKKLFWKIESEDNAFLILKNKKNNIASLHSSATQWSNKFLLEIYFEKGYLNLEGLITSTKSYIPETLKIFKKKNLTTQAKDNVAESKNIIFDEDRSWELEIKNHLSIVQTNRKKKPDFSSIDSAIDALKVVEKVYQKNG